MGWFKATISLKILKSTKHKQLESAVKKSNGAASSSRSTNESGIIGNGASKKNQRKQPPTENGAAIRIQSAFRAYKARKTLRRLRGIVKFRGLIEKRHDAKNQASSALSHIHFWSRIQTEIKARWLAMVNESQTRQKRLQNQLKLEAKLHDLEVEWCGGPETMEEILSRIQQREEASTKRERAMAYAFSHQWRASSSQHFGQAYYDLGKESWGWSWKERWIAVRPWENRVQSRPTHTKKLENKHKTSEITNMASKKVDISVKPALSNGKFSTNSRKLLSRVSHEATT